jgi:hypothetical protein
MEFDIKYILLFSCPGIDDNNVFVFSIIYEIKKYKIQS